MKTLKVGSTGPLVEFLQNLLKRLGVYKDDIDGVFGDMTKNAVTNFQNSTGLKNDGIVGYYTWQKLMPYINGGLNFVIPTNINYSYSILEININTLKSLYSFLDVYYIGKSVLGNNIPVIKIGKGVKKVFYSASIHANEWITTPVLMKFLADYCCCYVNNLPIYGINPNTLYNDTTIYIMPMVNPDGVNLVTGELKKDTNIYESAQIIANNYPDIPFPSGWKANIRGVDL